MRASHFMWAALTIVCGVALFLLKYKVQDLEHQLVSKRAQIVRDQGAIRVLQAEWTYLNDPERLRRQSEEYLGFHPATSQNVGQLAALPFRANANLLQPVLPPDGLSPGQVPQINFAAPPAAPQIHTELRTPAFAQTVAHERSSIMSASFARLQRLLLPPAAGATTFQDER